MNNILLRWLLLAFGVGTLAVLLSGCIVPAGGYGYDDGVGVGVGVDYYEPYGGVYGGWGPGYHVAPFRGGDHRGAGGGGAHAYRSAPASRSTPSLPSHGGGGGGGRGGRGGGGGGGRR